MNYTKGKWKVVNYGSKYEVQSDKRIAVVDTVDDANLIAAAPEMYEALQAIIDECPNPKLPYGNRIVEIAKQALTKVEGRE